jgi:hypothetical protein
MKLFWKSKTLWFNALTIAAVGGDALLDTRLLDPNHAAIGVVGLAMVNAMLRLVTNSSVGFKG